MLKTSKEANVNYLAKVVSLKGLRKHGNADRLQVVTIDFQNVITGLDAKEGDIYVFFPVESKINLDFLSETNSFRDKTLNKDNTKEGFFEDKGRVKAMKLRGEKSMGYIVPSFHVAAWAGVDILPEDVGTEFDTIGNNKIVEKYENVKKTQGHTKQGKKPKVSRLIDGQVHLHVDTANLRKNAHKISPDDTISITYKTHGTSWWVANVLTKKRLSIWERIAKKLGIPVVEQVYDLIYGSRRVVKNSDMEDPKRKDHFYGYDLWEDIKNQIGSNIPKGFTLYGEMLGYDRNGGMIQKDFDYGCDYDNPEKPTNKLEVYRITHTNPDGLVTELSHPEIIEFCKGIGLPASEMLYYGTAGNWYKKNGITDVDTSNKEQWEEGFIQDLERTYNEKDCYMCDNKVPEEGIVVRKDSVFYFEAYKLKSFKFLQYESNQLDSGEVDTESQN
jgi:hypothetical protein